MRRIALLVIVAACGQRDSAQQAPAPAPAPAPARPDASPPDAETYTIDEHPPDEAQQLLGSARTEEHPGANGPRFGSDGARNDTGPTTPDLEARPGRVTIADKQALDDTTLTDDVVLAKVRSAYVGGVKGCYRRVLTRDPAARGKMILAFGVTDTGRVGAHRANSFDAELDACVTAQMAAWRFAVPKDKDGDATDAEFQITLQLVPD